MKNSIPSPIIAVLSEYLPRVESHASLDNLFMHADAPGDPPEGSKLVKVQSWLRRINKNSEEPLTILGRIVEPYVEFDESLAPESQAWDREHKEVKIELRQKLNDVIAGSGLRYHSGTISGANNIGPSKSLESLIRGRDIPSIDYEFGRAMGNVDSNPKEAVSAACNILESIFKVYIEDNRLETPQKLDLQNVWKVVRKDLGFDASSLEDTDLKKIVSGLFSVVDGIGAFRTHASSAHGHGRATYKIKPRHARLAINGAHTVAGFILESWDEKAVTEMNANKPMNP